MCEDDDHAAVHHPITLLCVRLCICVVFAVEPLVGVVGDPNFEAMHGIECCNDPFRVLDVMVVVGKVDTDAQIIHQLPEHWFCSF